MFVVFVAVVMWAVSLGAVRVVRLAVRVVRLAVAFTFDFAFINVVFSFPSLVAFVNG